MRQLLLVVLVLAIACSFASAQESESVAPTFSLTDKNVVIECGVAGTFRLSLPYFRDVQGGKPNDVELSQDGKVLTWTYPVGGKAKLELTGTDTVKVTFSELPDKARKARFDMSLPGVLKDGGKWGVGSAPLKEFPREKPEKPFLFQGNEESFTVIHQTGAGFKLSGFLRGSYQQLQDNREWNTNNFSWYVAMTLPAGNTTPSVTIKLERPAEASAKVTPLIDRYGQFAHVDFDTKVTSDEQLREDVQRDAAYYASLNPPATDRFGGMPGSREQFNLKQTGFFHIERIGDRQVLVNPDGNIFFQLGLCVFATPGDDYTKVRGRESIYEWLPTGDDPAMKSTWRQGDKGVVSFYLANRVRKFGKPFEHGPFVAESIERARKWGFNSAGAFSSWPEEGRAEVRKRNWPYVSFLPLGKEVAPELPAKKVWDPFDEGIEQRMDAAFASRVAPKADDPLVIGWFITNEPVIEDVVKVVPGLKGTWGAKRRLVQMLREKYPTIEAFNAAWETNAASFDALADQPLIVATRAASEDMQAYFELFLERRYSLVNEYFRKHNPNHLLIGDRWMPSTANNQTLVTVAGKYLDVVSVNYYAYGIDKAFLDRLHQWSGGKPLLLSEFYYSCRDQGLSGGGTRVADQRERGLAYRNYVEQAIATGYVIGVQWFSHIDQAATGRFFQGFNGEAFNNGIVNVADRPYKPFLEEAMKTNYAIYDVITGRRQPFAYDDPRFALKSEQTARTVAVSRMTGTVVLDGQRSEWPAVPPTRIGADRLVLGHGTDRFEAAYRLAWDDHNLYLYAEVTDSTPMQNKRDNKQIWADDSIELFTGPEQPGEGGTLLFSDRQVLIRAHAPDPDLAPVWFLNAPKQGEAQVVVVPAVDGTGYVVEAAISFEALGFVPKAGQEIAFDLCVNNGGGGRRQLAWNGTSRNSSNRSVWGRAEFTP